MGRNEERLEEVMEEVGERRCGEGEGEGRMEMVTMDLADLESIKGKAEVIGGNVQRVVMSLNILTVIAQVMREVWGGVGYTARQRAE